MVSGLVTSPWLQLRIFSGLASEIRMESKSAIKFARSYGEDRIFSPELSKPTAIKESGAAASRSRSVRLFLNQALLISLPPAPYLPAPCAYFSSIRHRDTATAARESAR